MGRRRLGAVVVFLCALAAWAALLLFTGRLRPEELSYSAFRAALDAGRVESVELAPSRIDAKLRRDDREPLEITTTRVEDPELVRDLLAAGVEVRGTGVGLGPGLLGILAWVVPLGLLFLWLRSPRMAAGAAGAAAFSRSKARLYTEREVKVTFADVAGADEAKQELEEVVRFLREPAHFAALGARIPKGVLLVGPPGTGKTLLARAVAGEAKVPFLSISGSEFVELFVGVGAARVRDLFAQARQLAPSIIFIDELDAVGKVRGLGVNVHEEREQALNQLLVEIDGFDPGVGVILMAATNRPEILDPALLRAGRFDRHVLLDRPDRVGRLAILRVHARKVKLSATVQLDALAAITAGLAGAELENVVNEAALLAVRRGVPEVEQGDLEAAFERVAAGPERRSRVLSRAERERIAHHEVGHALVALALPGSDEVRKISVIPRGIGALGYTLQAPSEDRLLRTRSELLDRIAVFLAGQVAEELVFGEVSTGAEDDLRRATEIARAMVTDYGMGRRLGTLSHERPGTAGGARQLPHGAEVTEEIDREVRALVEGEFDRDARLLQPRLELLRRTAALLLQRETLSGEELAALVAQDGIAVDAEPDGPSLH